MSLESGRIHGSGVGERESCLESLCSLGRRKAAALTMRKDRWPPERECCHPGGPLLTDPELKLTTDTFVSTPKSIISVS